MTQQADHLSPFHDGEISLQEQFGVRRVEALGRRAIRPFMPDQHREFFAHQPFLVAAARDAEGRPWATVLEGDVGFVNSPDSKSLAIASQPAKGDALEGMLRSGVDLGLIGIELATRRRNRVNGRISDTTAEGLKFLVDQSFGNCPQHIHARNYTQLTTATPGAVTRHKSLTVAHQNCISAADTFFIASGYRGEGEHPSYGMDASHRGGAPGFVRVMSSRQIRFPDYPGNNYYNTLGNIQRDGRAGLLFLDFASGSLLQLTGCAKVDASKSDFAQFPGARRIVTIEIDEVVELPSALRLRWDKDGEAVRELRLIEKRVESADSTSFVFEPRDRGEIHDFSAGQFLPIEVTLPGMPEKIRRSYSLTNLPGQSRYRITVKRDPHGVVSRYLHDFLEVGDLISAFRPAGEFTLPSAETPIMFVSAGIGITPMMSMVQAALEQNPRRDIWFLHAARDAFHHTFAFDLDLLRRKHPALRMVTFYSQAKGSGQQVSQHHFDGRLTPDILSTCTPPEGAAFFICGPTAFAMDWTEALRQRGVPDTAIQTESFGASKER